MDIATQHTRLLANAAVGTRTINSGNPLMICGIVVANTAAAAITLEITDAAGVALMTIEVGANSTVTQEAPWLADTGFIVALGAAATIVTVLWRPSG